MAKLVILPKPGAKPREVPLGSDSITFGREPENEIQLDGLEVSRRHCRIEPLSAGGYRVLDLKSKNGTFLNGREVSAMALDFDDYLRVGDALVVYVEDDVAPAEALGRIDATGTSWLPTNNDPASLLEDDSAEEEEGSTWRSARARQDRQDLRNEPGTRGANRSYLKERLLRLGLLTQNIASAPDLTRLMDTIVDEVLDFTGFERGLLLLSDEEDGRSTRLQPVLGRYMDHERLDEHERRFSKGLVEEALREKRITIRIGLGALDDSFSLRESVISMGLESALVIPLHIPRRVTNRPEGSDRRKRRRSRRILGAIYLDSTAPVRPLDQADMRLLEAVAAQAAIALQHARLHHQATTDPLTGLANRAYIKQAFEDELKRAKEEGESLGVLILDLDKFKRINDTYGHGVGDEVLKRVAQRIRRSIRRDDHASRWGGEEFVIVLPGNGREGTLVVADKIANAIKSQPIGEVGVTVTASIGVAVFPKHGDTPSVLIKRADQALYKAKADGRDRTVVFSKDLDHTGHRIDPFEGLFDGDPAHAQRNLKAIFDTIDLLRSNRPPQEILARTLDNVCDLTRARRALLIVLRGDELVVTCARLQGGKEADTQQEFSRSTIRTSIEEERSLCLLDADKTARLSSSSIDRLGLNTVMCVPLRAHDAPVGVLYADDTVANREFGEKDLSHLEMIAHQLGLTLAANPELYQAALGEVGEKDETARLRNELLRLKAQLVQAKDQTQKFKRMLDERTDDPS